jgi:hypothetical protein
MKLIYNQNGYHCYFIFISSVVVLVIMFYADVFMTVWRHWCVFKTFFGGMRKNDDWFSPYFVFSQQIGKSGRRRRWCV